MFQWVFIGVLSPFMWAFTLHLRSYEIKTPTTVISAIGVLFLTLYLLLCIFFGLPCQFLRSPCISNIGSVPVRINQPISGCTEDSVSVPKSTRHYSFVFITSTANIGVVLDSTKLGNKAIARPVCCHLVIFQQCFRNIDKSTLLAIRIESAVCRS